MPRTRRPRPLLLWLSLLVVGGGAVALLLPGPLVEWMWMASLGYAGVFGTTLAVQGTLFAVAAAAVAACLGVHLYVLLRHYAVMQWLEREGVPRRTGEAVLSPRLVRLVATAGVAFVALLFGLRFGALWEAWLRFSGSTPTGTADPLFGHDVSFYLLRLPFVEAVQDGCSALALLALALVAGGYVFLGFVTVEQGRLHAPRRVARHLAVAFVLLAAAWGWGFFLDRYALLYGASGALFGARYVDVHVVLPALWVMVAASAVLGGLALYGAFSGRLRLLAPGVAVYVVLALLGLAAAPAVVQSVRVEPNELELETPYLEHNIAFTRRAYGIDRVEERPYPAQRGLTAQVLATDRQTLETIRLWDPRVLVQTFRQLQEIRPYYQFYDVDVDRYRIDSVYTQVLLSARELEQELPERANTWVNRHLQYTHGYGLAMALAADEGVDGAPRLLVRDLPPVAGGGLTVTQPALYFGEQTPTYRIVQTRVQEMDYPRGDDNAYTRYAGTGGVRLGSFWRRLVFALYMGDFNIVFSEYVTPDSRIQYWNRLQERVYRIAPFLRLDADPYLVLADGRLYWVQDAYTTARTYPYAEPTEAGFNYIRNAVKVVVDAYEGSVAFYVSDPEDRVLRAYRAAFPALFRDLAQMPAALRDHLRYPEDLFTLQVDKYNRYHMTAPQVFYNNEDVWAVAREQYAGEQVAMEPYYLLSRLPGETSLEYVLMQPLTPRNRDNMVAWMAARCDPAHYGQLVVYKLPKERQIYGPSQVESRIDQDSEISQQLALWDRRGSRVLRGNLIVVPVEQGFLYVEPVFLIGQSTQIPELQRVIAATEERVVMAPTLDEALQRLLGAALPPRRPAAPGAPPAPPAAGPTDALARAREAYDRAMEALRRGDFATFGARMDSLRRILHETNSGDAHLRD